MRRTNIYLTTEQSEALRERARAEGISRAELIRRLLDRALSGEADTLEDDLLAISDSFGVWRDHEVRPDRDDSERGRHLERIAGATS